MICSQKNKIKFFMMYKTWSETEGREIEHGASNHCSPHHVTDELDFFFLSPFAIFLLPTFIHSLSLSSSFTLSSSPIFPLRIPFTISKTPTLHTTKQQQWINNHFIITFILFYHKKTETYTLFSLTTYRHILTYTYTNITERYK